MTATLMGPREAARATGVSTDTLRHYERNGLLPEVQRTSSGYRRYPAATVERVLLIQRALVVGFSLADLKRVLRIRDQGGAPCHSVRALLDQRLEALTRQIEELRILRNALRTLAADWDRRLSRTPQGQQAQLLDTLGTHDAIEMTRGKRRRTHARATGSAST
jgi:MerR family transcriptional regulator, Zn(II)-responsive regulator of zntA